jgi:8-oxo-dGTP diphosphatase
MGKTPPTSSTLKILSQIEVHVVVFTLRENRLQVLLEFQPSSGKWQLPGLPLPIKLSLEETAAQCVTQFTGLHEAYLEQLYTYFDPNQNIVSVVYFALVPADSLLNCKDESKSNWFPVEPMPPLIRDHGEILTYALRRLRYKLEYSAVGFELLPEHFSLSELQFTYELILGEKLDKRNFRRRILQAGIIESTPHRRTGEGRPAQLYRYRPDAVAEVKARRLFP